MANVKKVRIVGTIPFDGGGDAELLAQIGRMAFPVFGFKIDIARREEMVPNDHGGQTAVHKFWVEGEEAVSFSWLRGFCLRVLKAGGTLDVATYAENEFEKEMPILWQAEMAGRW